MIFNVDTVSCERGAVSCESKCQSGSRNTKQENVIFLGKVFSHVDIVCKIFYL